jgi:hypothetical protein
VAAAVRPCFVLARRRPVSGRKTKHIKHTRRAAGDPSEDLVCDSSGGGGGWR